MNMAGASTLRIIAGEFRGRLISGPGRGDKTRPTLERVRESLFDILAYRLKGVRVLDLCAGTGALGLEAISRGARTATFLEAESRNVAIIRENIASLNVGIKCSVVQAELPFAVGRLKGQFDMVFFDPPYDSPWVERVVKRLGEKSLLAPNAIVIVERDRRAGVLQVPTFAIDRRHRIGDAELWFLRQRPPGSKRAATDE